MATKCAVFAGGCFWGTQKLFKDVFGERVRSVVCGYAGGAEPHPTYQLVCGKSTRHAEVVQIVYEESKVKYSELADLL